MRRQVALLATPALFSEYENGALAILAGAGRDEPEPEETEGGVVLATAEARSG